jgi:hypothetical protein
LERHRYKDPRAVIAERFQSYAIETAAGLADIFKRPIYRVLYVSVEVTETTYDISVLQDTHPITIAGGLIQPVPGISHVRASLEIKHRIAEKASPLKQILGQAKAKAVEKTIEARDAGGGMDM